MRWALLAGLLGGCAMTVAPAAPYCTEPGRRIECSDVVGEYAVLCAGGVDPDECGSFTAETVFAFCDVDAAPRCPNGAEPFCEPLPDCP